MSHEDFVLINEKGLFGRAEFAAVITEHAHKKLHEAFLSNPPDKPDTQKKLADFFSLTKNLFVEKKYTLACKDDHAWPPEHQRRNPNSIHYGSVVIPCLGFYTPSTFVTNSNAQYPKADKPISPDYKTWGLQEAIELQKIIPAVHDFAQSRGLQIQIERHSAVKKTVKRFEEGGITFKIKNNALDLGQVHACVVYLATKNPGYLDGRGAVSPLAGARLFESAGSAKRTITSRGLGHQAIVVHVRAELTGIEPDQVMGGGEAVVPLREAIALIEKQNLEKALESATQEQLQERLKKLEQQLGAAPEPEAPTRPRRM